ncbi:hypothetical protein AX16_007390 [Volvariella volvacea WC 439]|nr:hypothetical protein AX16_007390 [Volvariella volvacea WC 439]
MHLSDEFRDRCIEILQSPLFQQTAPLLVLIVVPALILTVATKTERSFLITSFAMLLDGAASLLPWNWSLGGAQSHSSSRSNHHGKGKKGKHVRTRAEQVAMNGRAKHGSRHASDDDGYYPGLVNIPGNYCFMNSTLQALASLSYLQPHIDVIHDKAERWDVPTPVIDALQDLFHRLNSPRRSNSSIEPREIIRALRQSENRANQLLSSREHQDAQELFQLLSESIKNETIAVDKESHKDRGLGGFALSSEPTRETGKSVFDGLTANRRSCVECGYTEAVMHFAFDNWQLAVPRMVSSVPLEACLEEYTRLETLYDSICRKCSLVATQRHLLGNIAVLDAELKSREGHTSSKKRKSKENSLHELRRQEARVRSALDEGRIEDSLEGVEIQKIVRVSTKQAMIARPPQVLALHINRSVYGTYAAKNNIFVHFPEVLDLTPYTTSGNLSTNPKQSISAPPTPLTRSATPTPSTYTYHRTYYRLSAVVCHYGQHSFGHYICFRRKPRKGGREWTPPRLVDPLTYMHDDGVGPPQYIWEGEEPAPSGTGWLRISDENVRECGIQNVLQEGSSAFMLYYERAVLVREGVYPSTSDLRGSEETLKPETKTVALNGSATSLVSEIGVGVRAVEEKPEKLEKKVNGSANGSLTESEIGGSSLSTSKSGRIIRRTAAGKLRRSSSAKALSRESSTASSSADPLSHSTPVLKTGKEEREKEKSHSSSQNGHAHHANGHHYHDRHHRDRSHSSSPKSPKSEERRHSPPAPIPLQERSVTHSSALPNGNAHSSTVTSRLPPKHPLPHRIPSPSPSSPSPSSSSTPRASAHEAGPSPVVGLKA